MDIGKVKWFILGASLASLVLLNVNRLFTHSSSGTSQLRLGLQNFTNPLLACAATDSTATIDLTTMRNKLAEQAKKQIGQDQAKRISIYFRDLDSGHWTGVNENELYHPASLIKVPLMLAYYQMAEDDSSLLNKRYRFDGIRDENELAVFRPPVSLKAGQYYSVAELIRRMIVFSGNNSYRLLLDNLNKNHLAQVYADLDISVVDEQEVKVLMSPKSFSIAWRVLYNASYLNRQMSNQALTLLSQVEFNEGLRAGIPLEIPIAHKFGERTTTNQGTVESRELHDCGIVYYPQHPYFLCVMTRGDDFDKLKVIIQDISRLAHTEAAKYYLSLAP